MSMTQTTKGLPLTIEPKVDQALRAAQEAILVLQGELARHGLADGAIDPTMVLDMLADLVGEPPKRVQADCRCAA